MSTNPAAQFKAGVDSNDLQAFENTNGVKIPQELVTYYTWHNSVHIDRKLYLPSLEEAYHLFKVHKHAKKPHSDIKEVASATLEELKKFLISTDEKLSAIRCNMVTYICNRLQTLLR